MHRQAGRERALNAKPTHATCARGDDCKSALGRPVACAVAAGTKGPESVAWLVWATCAAEVQRDPPRGSLKQVHHTGRLLGTKSPDRMFQLSRRPLSSPKGQPLKVWQG